MQQPDIGDRRVQENDKYRRLFDKLDEQGKEISKIKQKVYNGLSSKTKETHERIERMDAEQRQQGKDIAEIKAVLQDWGRSIMEQWKKLQETALTKEEHNQIEMHRHEIDNARHDAVQKAERKRLNQIKIGFALLGVLMVVAPEVVEAVKALLGLLG